MLLFVDIRRGGGSSEEISTEEGNSSENEQNSGESDKNVDNSGDLSTSGGDSTVKANTTSVSSEVEILHDSDGYYVEMGEYPTTFAGYVSSTSYTSTSETFTLVDGTVLTVYTDGTDRYIQITASPNDTSYYYNDNTNSVTSAATWFKIEPIQWQIVGVYNDDGVTGSSTSSITAYTGQGLTYGQSLVLQVRYGLHGCVWNISAADTSIVYAGVTIYSYLNNLYSYILSDYCDYIVSRSIDYNTTANHTSLGDYYDNYTTENVWLMSYDEASSWFTTREERLAVSTDFALGTGSYMNGDRNSNWWLRTSFVSSSLTYVGVGMGYGGIESYPAYFYNCTFRPCMLVDLTVDLGVYNNLTDEDGEDVIYWISNVSYMSESWLGEGTEDSPYLIQSAGDLALLSYTYFVGDTDSVAGCYFLQTADIDLSGTQYNSNGLYWMPIGGSSSEGASSDNFTTYEHVFTGYYDGGNNTISGLVTFYDEDMVYADENSVYNFCRQGLFGAIRCINNDVNVASAISNITLANSTIVGAVYCGGICGWSNHTVFSNCHVKSDVSITGGSYSAGIIGAIGGSTSFISGCVNEAKIICSEEVSGYSEGYCYGTAGIVGLIYSHVNVSNCYNTGDVYGECEVGGIVGAFRIGIVGNCYNTGTISSSYSYVGGIIGHDITPTDETSEIVNCFNLGEVTGELYVGAIIGEYGEITFSHNYYGGQCSQIGGLNGSDVDGEAEFLASLSVLARTKAWLLDEDVWDADYAWDFDSVWAISNDVNNAYPYLLTFGNFGSDGGVKYDSAEGYWFYEDGMLPQSVVSDSTLISNLKSSAVVTGETFAIGGEKFSVYAYGGSEYVKVTAAGKNGTASDSGCTWFLVESVVWIVAYGADYPSEEVATAVSALVVTLGAYVSSSTYDATFLSLYATTSQNSESAISSGELNYSVVDSIVYDAFNTTASQTVVYSVNLGNVTDETGNTSVTSAGYRVASVNEIDALGGAYATECSDFVAFLLSGGASTSGYVVDYWTRDLAYELGSDSYYGASSFDGIYRNGVYVTEDGVIMNASLKNVYGARLSVSL